MVDPEHDCERADHERKPAVLVLLAAYNGVKYLDAQIDSIIQQQGVEVSILVSVDASSDGTEALVSTMSASIPQVAHLAHGQHFGGAAPNFYRLLLEADLSSYDFVALSDQDDVWLPEKLRTAAQALQASGSGAYSCNVMAWHEDGRQRLVNKATRQRAWDHLFSAAGPGCSYVFRAEALQQFQEWLRAHEVEIGYVDLHDWLLYAWTRSNGFPWHMDSSALMLYRQHGDNQVGVNRGWDAAVRRLARIRDGWYLRQVLQIATCVGALEEKPIRLLRRPGVIARLRLAGLAPQLRRTRREAAAIASIVLLARRPGDQDQAPPSPSASAALTGRSR